MPKYSVRRDLIYRETVEIEAKDAEEAAALVGNRLGTVISPMEYAYTPDDIDPEWDVEEIDKFTGEV